MRAAASCRREIRELLQRTQRVGAQVIAHSARDRFDEALYEVRPLALLHGREAIDSRNDPMLALRSARR
jgi:hypothetical protein